MKILGIFIFLIGLIVLPRSSFSSDISSQERASAPYDAFSKALEEAIQDEYWSRETYAKVIFDFGQVWPFVNIVEAEKRHIAALARLFKSYELEVPESRWNEENVPSYDSVAEACAAGVVAETKNVAMYDRLMARSLPNGVRFVFGNLRRASLENHLPAFRRCSEEEDNL